MVARVGVGFGDGVAFCNLNDSEKAEMLLCVGPGPSYWFSTYVPSCCFMSHLGHGGFPLVPKAPRFGSLSRGPFAGTTSPVSIVHRLCSDCCGHNADPLCLMLLRGCWEPNYT